MAFVSDICLVLEGTYPYVTGGVSSWVHGVIKSLPEFNFSLLVILPDVEYAAEKKYEIPDNVSEIHEVFIHDYQIQTIKSDKARRREGFQIIQKFLDGFFKNDFSHFPELVKCLGSDNPMLSDHDIFYSRESWDIMMARYLEDETDVPFNEMVWNFRFSLIPILKILRCKIPRARLYHAVSTGYAGIAASVALVKHPWSSIILTEHGIYTNERRIEIAQMNWLFDEYASNERPDNEQSFFKKWWNALFKSYSSIIYNMADQIITLYEGNRTLQISDGADPEKCILIPNGISVDNDEFKTRKGLSTKDKVVIALVGRVVQIKDIKTFIQASKILISKDTRIECWVIGPTDEEPEYFGDCVIMQSLLGITESFIFKGRVNMKDYYPDIDILVLTSISEAMPLVILEAHAYGIPAVATDVGACHEMLNGQNEQDRELGPSGIVTEIAAPEATAKAIYSLIESDEFYEQCSLSGWKRLVQFYDIDNVYAEYRNVYRRNL